MFILPEEYRINYPARPFPRTIYLPAPRVGGKRFIGPGFLAKQAGHKDIPQLVKRNCQLVNVMP